MSRGFVYIMTNPSMATVVKIGKTTRTPEQRRDELWQTGVPTPFEVFASVFSPDCHQLERDIHVALRGARVSQSREFFYLPASEALEELNHLHRLQVDSLIAEFLPHHCAVHESIAVNEEELVKLGNDLGISPAQIISAVPSLDAESLNAAIRYSEGYER